MTSNELPPVEKNVEVNILHALASLDERMLQASIIEPLLRAMDFEYVRDVSGPNEKGRDLIAIKWEFGRPKVYAIQIKRTEFTGKQASSNSLTQLLTQLRQVFTEPGIDPLLQTEGKAHRCIFITPYQINRSALESAFHDIMEHERREITIVDGPILAGLIERYLPKWFEQLASGRYSAQLIEMLDSVPESRAFDLSRELRIREIYIDVAFAPMLTLGSALMADRIPKLTSSDIFCAPADLDELREIPFWADDDAIKPLNPACEVQFLENKKKEIACALSAATKRRDRKAVMFLKNQIADFEKFVVRLVDVRPMCRNLNRRIQVFRKTFDRLREPTASPKTIARIVRKGLELGAGIRHLTQNHTIQDNWPQIPQAFARGSVDPSWQLPGTVLSAIEDPIVVFGPPGAGKTTLLRRLAIEQAHWGQKVLPIFIQLNRIKDASRGHLLTECRMQLRRLGLKIANKQLEREIRAGRYRLFLDGLDEVGPNAAKLFLVLQKFCQESKRSRIVVSSREYHDYGDWPNAVFVRLAPFNDSQTIAFIEKWFRTAPSNRVKLQNWLESSPSMKEIARTPMVLTQLCSLVDAQAELPATEVGLYQKRFELLLGRWELAKGIPQMPEEMRARYWHFLIRLAFETHKEKARNFSYSAAVDLAQSMTSIGLEHEPVAIVGNCLRRGLIELEPYGGFSFGHLTYQEFLAANWLSHYNPVDWVAGCLPDPWWKKALEFYAAIKRDIGQLLTFVSLERDMATRNYDAIIHLARLAPLTPKLQLNEYMLQFSPKLPRT
jgi:hypothetical protein